MGWLLTLLLAFPQVNDPVRVEMWFSREMYCTLAREKFAEQPMVRIGPDGRQAPVGLRSATCRELDDSESRYVPRHMRQAMSLPDGTDRALP